MTSQTPLKEWLRAARSKLWAVRLLSGQDDAWAVLQVKSSSEHGAYPGRSARVAHAALTRIWTTMGGHPSRRMGPQKPSVMSSAFALCAACYPLNWADDSSRSRMIGVGPPPPMTPQPATLLWFPLVPLNHWTRFLAADRLTNAQCINVCLALSSARALASH